MTLKAPIAAIATAAGRAAVGIVRVSGDDLTPVIRALCGRQLKPREASYLAFLAADGSTLDRGLAIHFPAPNSYTGEDVLELQAHGGSVVLQLLLGRCIEAGASLGMRLAAPGEFTERAFLNGKIDLAQAEAVIDLIDASTEAAARSASRSLSGAFSNEITLLQDELVSLRALVEATLDFPEEELDFLERANARGRLGTLSARVGAVLDRARQGALLHEGIKVVLAGQPNVGKSSLFNALAGAELAIVTAVPGTTRDKVSETVQIEGVPVRLVDTAGLRVAADEVERIGVERSWVEIEAADAVIFIHDLSRIGSPAYDEGDALIGSRLPPSVERSGRLLHVFNKADLSAGTPRSLAVSAVSGQGLDVLRAKLLEVAGWQAQPEGVFMARSRHVLALERTQRHLAHAEHHAASKPDEMLDVLAEELRLAHNALSEITGAYTPDDLLGEIFGKFCIGK